MIAALVSRRSIKATDRLPFGVFLAIGLWLLAVVNPPILKIIGAMSAPIIALYCYIMPVMLMKRVPRLAIYRTRWAALVFLFGLVTIVGYGVAEFL